MCNDQSSRHTMPVDLDNFPYLLPRKSKGAALSKKAELPVGLSGLLI
jgi:hypothetical protein